MKRKRQCEEISPTGERCNAYALRDSDPPRCLFHSRTPEERSEHAREAAQASALARRATAEPGAQGLALGVTTEDVLALVGEGLSATYADAGLPGQADWPTRLLACLVLLSTFPRAMRRTPEQAQAALAQALPASARQDDPEAAHRLSVSAAYTLARREWNKLKLRYSPLVGLYTEEYPDFLIAPWEDRARVLREERPPPIPPREAEDLLTRAPSGELYVRRNGALPLLIQQD